MREKWKNIEDFDLYAVSNFGRVMNTDRETIKMATANQQGIPSVLLINEGRQFRRSVAVLVAKAFLHPHRWEAFDTPINLDGDRWNNHIDNLVWRSRAFAIAYHMQFKKPLAYGWKEYPVRDVESGVVYPSIRACAVTHGLIEGDIIISAMNEDEWVFPTRQYFKFVR